MPPAALRPPPVAARSRARRARASARERRRCGARAICAGITKSETRARRIADIQGLSNQRALYTFAAATRSSRSASRRPPGSGMAATPSASATFRIIQHACRSCVCATAPSHVQRTAPQRRQRRRLMRIGSSRMTRSATAAARAVAAAPAAAQQPSASPRVRHTAPPLSLLPRQRPHHAPQRPCHASASTPPTLLTASSAPLRPTRAQRCARVTHTHALIPRRRHSRPPPAAAAAP
jgi:hypothetical protein